MIGRNREEIVKKELAAKLKKKVNTCELFIDGENLCLGALPLTDS